VYSAKRGEGEPTREPRLPDSYGSNQQRIPGAGFRCGSPFAVDRLAHENGSIEVSGNAGRALVDLLLQISLDVDLALAHRIERAAVCAKSGSWPCRPPNATCCSASSPTHPTGSSSSAANSHAITATDK
jgi:hypothetical protein